jgi:hypothetical protein
VVHVGKWRLCGVAWPTATGVIRSRVFPGLWLAADALLAGDLAAVLAAAPAWIGKVRDMQ